MYNIVQMQLDGSSSDINKLNMQNIKYNCKKNWEKLAFIHNNFKYLELQILIIWSISYILGKKTPCMDYILNGYVTNVVAELHAILDSFSLV